MFIRLIIWIFLFYFIYKIVHLMFKRPSGPRSAIRGKSKKEKIDLSDVDIEDAKFKEIKKKS